MVRTMSFTAMVLLVGASFSMAQVPPPQRPRAAGGELSPVEITRMLDAYALIQAQATLGLTDDQYARFVVGMKNLQEARRRLQIERARLLRELNRLSSGEESDEAVLLSALSELKQHDQKAAAELVKSYDTLDEALTPRQRARFRLLEENMERRKIDLLMRARQVGRQNRDPGR